MMGSRIKIGILFLLTVLLLCGCTGQVSYVIQPSAVPMKWVTKTAAVPAAGSADTLPEIDPGPWKQCSEAVVSGAYPEKVSEIRNEEFRRRVQITFMIQEDKTDTSYIAERCMNGRVYVCLIDGITNCAEKLDFSVEPNERMQAFCKDEEKEGAILSPSVTGINSAFEWRCHEGTAVITAQIADPDPDGYDRSVWYEIPAPGG